MTIAPSRSTEPEPIAPAASRATASSVGVIEPEPAKPEPVFTPADTVTAEQPIIREPAAPAPELQGDLFETPTVEAADANAREPAPTAASPTRRLRPTEDEDRAAVRRSRPLGRRASPPQKGGCPRSLFGGRARAATPPAPLRDCRHDPTPVPAGQGGGWRRQLGGAADEEEPEDAGDDLEIPSFLRRLAN